MSSRICTLAAAAALVLVFSTAVAAQTGAVLSGIVHDRSGTPVPGVVLTVVNPVTGDTRVVVSDQSGAYFVDRLHYGMEYAVDVNHPRFRTSRVRANANEGDTAVDITLAPRRSRLASVLLFPIRVLSLGTIGRTRVERPSANGVPRAL